MNPPRVTYLLIIAIIFLLMAQYVVNDYPWDRIFRIMGLVTIVGAILFVIAQRFQGARPVR